MIVFLCLWAAIAHAQATAPKPQVHNSVQVEVKPPDEPSSSLSPQAEPLPDATSSVGAMPPSSGSYGDSGGPIAADAVAHPPEIETYVVPDYPPKARRQGVQGRVLLMVIVDESGKVEDNIEVVDSVPMLDQAAIDAVHRWSFTPARDADGNPVRVRLEVPVRFTPK